LNTKGGFLFIGVSDNGIVQGINDEEYDDHDHAAMYLQNHIKNYLGSLQEKFVEIKVIRDENKNDVIVAKVEKCNVETYMRYSKFDETGGKIKGSEKKAFFVKDNQSVDDYEESPADKALHIKTFFTDNPVKMKSIPHSFEISKFVSKDIPSPPRLEREFGACNKKGCEFIGKSSEDLNNHSSKCEFQEMEEKASIPGNSYCKIPYREEPWPDWLKGKDMRVSQLKKLICNTSFTIIGFKDSRSAVEHFMLTNDSSRFEPLNSYDLVSAFTVKLMRTKNNESLSSEQKKIEKLWNSVSNDLYITTEKNDQKINSFFFNWLLSTNRREKPAKRYTKDKSWNGIKKEFDDRTNDDGSYKFKKMVELYKEMQLFAKIYLRLTNTNHKFWQEEPYCNSPFREERNLLRILGTNTSEVQHIPPLMCLTNRLNQGDFGRNMIIKFLKNYNYILLRYKTIPVSTGGSPGIKGGMIYGKMQSGKGIDWISKILNANLENQDDVKMIGNLPLELEDDVADKEPFVWEKDHSKWSRINQWSDGIHKKSKTQIRHLLFSAERALNTEKTPIMASIHVNNKDIHVEHILPEDYSQYHYQDDSSDGYVWPIENSDEDGLHNEEDFINYWRKYVYSLGNQCLLSDTSNSSIKNRMAITKFFAPMNDIEQPFKNSEFLTARKAHDLFFESKLWEPEVIESNSKNYMNAIVNFFTPN